MDWETGMRLWECDVCEDWTRKTWRELPECPFCGSMSLHKVQNPQLD